jgi:4-hydroxymandelate oxidase
MEEMPLERLALRELRELARERMPSEAWRHVMGAAESGATLRRNRAAFRRLLFRQRIFHDVTRPDLAVELFHRTLPFPICVAPIGSFSLIHPSAEREVAVGADRVGAMVFVSHAAKLNPRQWAEGLSAPFVFMGYLSRGREDVLRCARMAEDEGYAAVGLTMDTIQPVKIGDHVPLSTKDGKPRVGHPASPKDIEWLKSQVSLPLVVKGIMGAADAVAAIEHGADALIVSNHGGRILDFNRAAIEALPEVIDAVGGRVPVLLDSGIRSGGDIVKALALGARAVLVGRPIAWGVAAAGAAGVARVLELLAEEMRRVLILTGTPAARDLDERVLVRDGL